MDVLVVAVRSAIAQDPVLSLVAAGVWVATWVVLVIQYRLIKRMESIELVSVYLYMANVIAALALSTGLYGGERSYKSVLLIANNIGLLPMLLLVMRYCLYHAYHEMQDRLSAYRTKGVRKKFDSEGSFIALHLLAIYFLTTFVVVLIFRLTVDDTYLTLTFSDTFESGGWSGLFRHFVTLLMNTFVIIIMVVLVIVRLFNHDPYEEGGMTKIEVLPAKDFLFFMSFFAVNVWLALFFLELAYLIVLVGLVHQFSLLWKAFTTPSIKKPETGRASVGALSFLKMVVSTAAVWFWYYLMYHDTYKEAYAVALICSLTQTISFGLYIYIWFRNNWSWIKHLHTYRIGP